MALLRALLAHGFPLVTDMKMVWPTGPQNTHACTLAICGICVTLSRPADNETVGNRLYLAEPTHTTSDPSVKVRNGRAALDPLVGRSVASNRLKVTRRMVAIGATRMKKSRAGAAMLVSTVRGTRPQ